MLIVTTFTQRFLGSERSGSMFLDSMLPQYMALCVCLHVPLRYIKKKFRTLLSKVGAEIWYVDCSYKYKINQFVMVDGRQPLVEDDLWWKTIFGGRQPSVDDNLWWKTTFVGRQPWMEDNLSWKKTFSGRHP